MVSKIPNRTTALLPDRHPQTELFICDLADAVLKDDMASMEHPIFTLSKKPDLRVRRYEHGDKWLEVTPSVKGVATIYDKDVLIYAISQLMAAKQSGRSLGRKITMSGRDLLVFTNRHTGGRDYELLKDALVRLRGTTLATNIETGGEAPTRIFGLVEEATIETDPKSQRVRSLAVTLSDWLYAAIEANEVLTLHRDYFRLRKPLERRIYEIARKHCGAQPQWAVSLEILQKKSGSSAPAKQFRHAVRQIAGTNHLPDYLLTVSGGKAIFKNRKISMEIETARSATRLDPETFNDARTCAPGWDVYMLEQEWRGWMASGGLDAPKNPDSAFLGFCRKWAERHGTP